MKVSVCMAAYHGAAFVEAQVRSVLAQLHSGDELLISDDDPADGMHVLLERLAAEDNRIRLLRGPGQGVIRNFESVLSAASGDVIFLADQDDVWLPEKREAVLHEIGRGACLVLHDAIVTDAQLQQMHPSFFALRHSRPGFVRNLIRNSYMGCCMAFTRDVLQKALQFPDGIPMHDQWIGLCAERNGKVCFLPRALLLYRRHDGNVTGAPTSFSQKLRWRFAMIRALLHV